ncbi:MAG: hypothetical protein AAFN00_10145, partial [Cyanobacteria bacterium J06558_2]
NLSLINFFPCAQLPQIDLLLVQQTIAFFSFDLTLVKIILGILYLITNLTYDEKLAFTAPET